MWTPSRVPVSSFQRAGSIPRDCPYSRSTATESLAGSTEYDTSATSVPSVAACTFLSDDTSGGQIAAHCVKMKLTTCARPLSVAGEKACPI